MPKTVVILQSNYIPWKGYFSLIHLADLFVFLDDIQYTVRDWRNRNRIKTNHGLHWLTIPVGSDRNRLICDVNMQNMEWKKKHWASIKHSYSRAPYFSEFRDEIMALYFDSNTLNLSEFNQAVIKYISRDILGLETEFADSSIFNTRLKGPRRLFEILDQIDDVGTYLTGPAASVYLDKQADWLSSREIDLLYMDYSSYPEYKQLYGPFVHEVSVLDLIFNCGPNAVDYIKNDFVKRMERS